MMKFLSVAILILGFCTFVFAQNNQNVSCPTVDTSNSGVPQPGDITYFSANVKGIDVANLTYTWEVTVGEIIKGQGTSLIEVQLPKEWKETLSARVEVKDFPKGCPNTSVETLVVSDSLQTKQTNKISNCPTIEISSSSELTQPGETIIFTVNVQNYDIEKLSYNWTITNGEFNGQGKPIISVPTNRESAGQKVTATVEIQGLPEGCKNTESISTEIGYICELPPILADYGRISFSKEKAYLDLVYLELNEKPDFAALFIIHFTSKDSISAIKIRVQKITDFLTKTRQIPKEQLKFVFSEVDSYKTTVYLLPPEVAANLP